MVMNNLYEQRKKFERNQKNVSRIKRLLISLAASSALVAGFAVPAFAASTNGTTNMNACFGQARSANAQGGPNSILFNTEGYYMSVRQGNNSTMNIAYRDNCAQ